MRHTLVIGVSLVAMLLLTACPNYVPEVLDFETDPRVLRGTYRASVDSRASVEGVALNPAGDRLLSWSYDAFRLWDAATGELLDVRWARPSYRSTAALTKDAAYLVSEYGGEITIWDMSREEPVITIDVWRHHPLYIEDMALSPDGRYLAVSSGWQDPGARLLLYEVASGDLLHSWQAEQPTGLGRLTFSADSASLAAADFDSGEVVLWRFLMDEVARLASETEFISVLALSPDGRYVATCADTGIIKLLERATGQVVRVLEGHESFVASLAFSADSSQLASGSYSGSVFLWNVETGQPLQRFTNHDQSVWSVTLVNGLLVTGNADATVTLWDASTFTELRTVVHGELIEATLELIPTYVSAGRYSVTGTFLAAEAPLTFHGLVDGNETQAYRQGLETQVRPPEPARLSGSVYSATGDETIWAVEAFQYGYPQYEHEANDWWGSAAKPAEPNAHFQFILNRDE